MNIYTVRDNLKTTIAGKEMLLADYRKASEKAVINDLPDRLTIAAMAGFLSTNLEELRKILADVETCCEQATKASWALDPERMGQ